MQAHCIPADTPPPPVRRFVIGKKMLLIHNSQPTNQDKIIQPVFSLKKIKNIRNRN